MADSEIGLATWTKQESGLSVCVRYPDYRWQSQRAQAPSKPSRDSLAERLLLKNFAAGSRVAQVLLDCPGLRTDALPPALDAAASARMAVVGSAGIVGVVS